MNRAFVESRKGGLLAGLQWPDVGAVERYRGQDDPDLELEVADVPSSVTRDALLRQADDDVEVTIGQLIGDMGDAAQVGRHLLVVLFPVPDEDLDEFDDWYETEHVPLLLEAPDWLRIRRYDIAGGSSGPWSRLVAHELASMSALSSSARERAKAGPKRLAITRHPWYGESARWTFDLQEPA